MENRQGVLKNVVWSVVVMAVILAIGFASTYGVKLLYNMFQQ